MGRISECNPSDDEGNVDWDRNHRKIFDLPPNIWDKLAILARIWTKYDFSEISKIVLLSWEVWTNFEGFPRNFHTVGYSDGSLCWSWRTAWKYEFKLFNTNRIQNACNLNDLGSVTGKSIAIRSDSGPAIQAFADIKVKSGLVHEC